MRAVPSILAGLSLAVLPAGLRSVGQQTINHQFEHFNLEQPLFSNNVPCVSSLGYPERKRTRAEKYLVKDFVHCPELLQCYLRKSLLT